MIQHMYHFLILAEGMRFELMRGFPLLAFQASALDHYANPPRFANVSFTISESKEKSKFFSDHPFALLRPLVSFAIFNEPFRPFPGLCGAPSLQEQYTFSIFCFAHRSQNIRRRTCGMGPNPFLTYPSARRRKREKDETANGPLDFCFKSRNIVTKPRRQEASISPLEQVDLRLFGLIPLH